MYGRVLALFLCLLLPAQAFGWNEKGHLAIARLAWLKLSACDRQKCSAILSTHPHYTEYLSADKPEKLAADEWAFMRAAYWPDWVRSNHSEEFNRPTWHYITAAYVPPYSQLKASDLTGSEPNVVTQISASLEKIAVGSPADRAIYLCWLLHLVGDIHQPLHCCSQLSELFPQGDQGGNLALVRIAGGMPVRLHFAWDAMLGDELDIEAILTAVEELQQFERQQNTRIADEIVARTSPAEWRKRDLHWPRRTSI